MPDSLGRQQRAALARPLSVCLAHLRCMASEVAGSMRRTLHAVFWLVLLGCSGVEAATIAGGNGHTLQIRDGILYAWGLNDFGQLGNGTNTSSPTPAVITLASGVAPTAVIAGNRHSMTIGTDGKLYAWGDNTSGQLGDGSITQRNTPVVVSLPAGVTAASVAAGSGHSMAIGSDGKLYAWGNNSYGQLGDGSTIARTTPVVVSLPAGVTATMVAAGSLHSLAIGSDGKLYAWGMNKFGQLGDGSTASRNTPVVVILPQGVVATAVVAGTSRSMAIGSDGKLYVWGDAAYGQLGIGTTVVQASTPVLASLPTGVMPVAVAAGGYHSLAFCSDGKLYAWGLNANGQLGDNSVVQRNAPVVVGLPTGVALNTLAAGFAHSLAYAADGTLYAWGDNSYGQLGTGQIKLRSKPVEVSMSAGVSTTMAAAGHEHNLAAGADGKVYAWGRGDSGQMGNGATTNRSTPVASSLPTGAAKLAVGYAHSLAIGTNGKLYAWGQGNVGALGNGTNTVSTTPVAISLPASGTPLSVAAGAYHSLAIGANGTLYAWGSNINGVLGDGSNTGRYSPVPITLAPGVSANAVASGSNAKHSLAMGSNGKLYAWGEGTNGQIGDGGATNRSTPVQVGLPAGVSAAAVSVGERHSLAIGSDGQLYAWGANTNGQIGDGSTIQRNTPLVIGLAPGITPVAIAAGDSHSLAIGSDGKLYAWGRNDSGQVGDGSTLQRTTPVLVSLPADVAPSAVSAGTAHSLAIGANGKLYAWGTTSYYGVLGDVNVYQSGVPSVVTSYPAPASDMFADRRLISGSAGTAYGSNLNATREPGEPVHDALASGKTVWWRWMAQSAGSLRLLIPVAPHPSVMAVYTGNKVDALTLLATGSIAANGRQVQIDFPVQAGVEYQIAVDGYSTTPPVSGNVTLFWSFGTAAPTSTGADIVVSPIDANTGTRPASIDFSQVSQAGETTVTTGTNAPASPSFTASCSPQVAVDISTTATFVGSAMVCLDPSQVGATCAANAALYHWSSGSGWTKLPVPADAPAGKVCGITTSFSPFAVFAPSSSQQAQRITFAAVPAQVMGASPFTVSATASSGLTVSFDSSTPSVCTVSGNTVTLLAVGMCMIGAHQAGDPVYAAAPDAVQSFSVVGQPQTIAFAAIANRTLGAAPFAISATASSGLTVSFDSVTPTVCAVSGNTVTLLAAGTCTISALQAGNRSYVAANDVQQSFNVAAQESGEGAGDVDVPLPLWALVALGGGLLAAVHRRAAVG